MQAPSHRRKQITRGKQTHETEEQCSPVEAGREQRHERSTDDYAELNSGESVLEE